MSHRFPHLSQGEIRAYLDQSQTRETSGRIEAHLAVCQRCRSRASILLEQSQRVQTHLQLLDQKSDKRSAEANRALRLRLDERLKEGKEKQPLKPKPMIRLPRYAWISLLIAAILVTSLAFEPVRALASEFLALFRVEQIRVISIDQEMFPEKLANSSQLEYILSNEVEVEEMGEPQEAADADQASNLAGFPLRLPAGVEGKQTFMVQPGARLSFKVNLELVRGVLKDIEREDIQLPPELDGAQVGIEIPTSAAVSYGDCGLSEYSQEQSDPDNPQPSLPKFEECITLMQIPSPVVSAPPNLDLNKIGEAYLQVLGMDPQEAARFSNSVNWATTFVVPIPRYSVEYEDVQVGGSTGTLIYDPDGYDRHFIIIWVDGGMIFALSGWGEKAKALEIANSIQ